MLNRDILISEYYAEKGNKVYTCPFQPGNLKISEKACLKRHQAALKKKLQPFRSEDLFNYFVSQSLIRCENCSIIKKIISRSPVQDFPPALHPRGTDQAKRKPNRSVTELRHR